MAVTYGFYDSLNHDRLYNAQQMSAIFDGIINDGVFMSVGNQFHTVAGTGMQVIVKSGRAWFDSTWTLNDAEYPLSIDAADVLLTRIDAVVLEVNSEVATRANTIKVVKGTPASTPAKPTLTNTATIHQHALAYVTVAKNTTAITNSMIEIVVGKTETPYVTAILQTTDITDLFKKWENDFQTWFETVRSTLDGDVALNLQNQIDALSRNTLSSSTPPKIGLPENATGNDMFLAFTNCGNLYEWLKNKITLQKYILADPINTYIGSGASTSNNSSIYCGITIHYAKNIVVTEFGSIVFIEDKTKSIGYNSNESTITTLNKLRGCFVRFVPIARNTSSSYYSKVYSGIAYIPNDATFAFTTSGNYPYGNTFTCNKLTPVNAFPASDIDEYLVSTKKDAYTNTIIPDINNLSGQLGEVVTGTFNLGSGYATNGYSYGYADDINVDIVGNISLGYKNASSVFIGYGSSTELNLEKLKKYILGKYIYTYGNNTYGYLADNKFPFGVYGSLVYIPADANITQSGDEYILDRYQPIPSITMPVNYTDTSYIGLFGKKSFCKVISYRGTGVSGSISDPIELVLPFAATTMIFIKNDVASNYDYPPFFVPELTSYYKQVTMGGFHYVSNMPTMYMRKSLDGKILYRYNDSIFNMQNGSYSLLCFK